MPYYVLARVPGDELYSMNMTLSEDEARRYGHEGEMVSVLALLVWTHMGALESFRQFLSLEQQARSSAFSELIKDMREDRVDVLELSADELRDRLSSRRRIWFVCINPGSDQRVQQTDEFLVSVT
jgi:hypothetical protein